MFARHLTVPSNMVLCLSGVHSILTLFSFQRSPPSCDGLYILPNSQELVKDFFFGRIEQFFTSSSKDIFRLCQGPLQYPVPDGLISISQLALAVNYFFTFFDKTHRLSIRFSILTTQIFKCTASSYCSLLSSCAQLSKRLFHFCAVSIVFSAVCTASLASS